MKTRIISAFPACGKTHLFVNSTDLGLVLDSDSSSYSWTQDNNGDKVRNPEFPCNYIQHIKENIGKVDYIFVSSHQDVRDALHTSGLSWGLVMPHKSLLNEWIGRCYQRGDQEGFIKLIIDNWDLWTNPSNPPLPNATTWLRSNEYLSDAMSFMSNVTPNTRKMG